MMEGPFRSGPACALLACAGLAGCVLETDAPLLPFETGSLPLGSSLVAFQLMEPDAAVPGGWGPFTTPSHRTPILLAEGRHYLLTDFIAEGGKDWPLSLAFVPLDAEGESYVMEVAPAAQARTPATPGTTVYGYMKRDGAAWAIQVLVCGPLLDEPGLAPLVEAGTGGDYPPCHPAPDALWSMGADPLAYFRHLEPGASQPLLRLIPVSAP